MKITPKKFEIKLFEADWENIPDNGNPRWKAVKVDTNPTIIVSSKKELDSISLNYKQCDQMFKIIRELPISNEEIIEYKTKNNIIDEESPSSNKEEFTEISENLSHEKEHKISEENFSKNENIKDKEIISNSPTTTNTVSSSHENNIKRKARFYKIGGIDIKDDNGIIYQKQWMKITEEEMSNLRIVNDVNNKIVSLDGKHIEVKKWIRVENIESNDIIEQD